MQNSSYMFNASREQRIAIYSLLLEHRQRPRSRKGFFLKSIDNSKIQEKYSFHCTLALKILQ